MFLLMFFVLPFIVVSQQTIRYGYDTIEEFNVDSKAEYSA